MKSARTENNPELWPSILLFTGLAWSITWLTWLPLVLLRNGAELPSWVRYCHYLGGFGPAVAAFIMARRERALGTGQALRRELTHWRVDSSLSLVSMAGPIVLFALAALLTGLTGEGWPDPSRLGTTATYPELGHLPYWITTTLCFGFGEEIGWRGFALPRLQRELSPLLSAVVISLIWSMWHLVAFFYNDNYAAMGVGGTMGWFLSMVTGSVILTWLFNASRGSILIVALFHAILDITISSPGPESIQMIMGAMITVAGIIILIATRGRLTPAGVEPVTL